MIKINKDISAIPKSLIPAFDDLFIDGKIPRVSCTTHARRLEIIAKQAYIDEMAYNSRYKTDDIKAALKSIYKNKCAFCESKVEQFHVEHYRPKTTYYWLAYSWDNLILACSTCNTSKGINFNIQGAKATFVDNEPGLRAINNSSGKYDQIEIPDMVNPEVTDPDGHIQFDMDGKISSGELRFAYTIEQCSIDRKYLNDSRRHLLEIFRRDITSALVGNADIRDQLQEISVIIKKFINDSADEDLEFLAFRRYVISSSWLSQIVKEMN